MPTRTFAFADVTNVVNGWVSGPFQDNSAFGVVFNNCFDFSLQGNGSYSGTFGSFNAANMIGNYQVSGDIVYDGVTNPIPVDASITRIKVRRPTSIVSSADAAVTTGNVDAQIVAQLGRVQFPNASQTAPDLINHSDTQFAQPTPQNLTFTDSFGGSAADTIFDLSGAPIDRATLVSLWSHFVIRINISIGAGSAAPMTEPQSAAISVDASVGNVEVEVTYTDAVSWNFSARQVHPLDEGVTQILTSPDPLDDPNSVDFTEVNQIDVEFEDPNNPGTTITINVPELLWTLITPRRLEFTMPSWGGYTPTVVNIVLHSTQFSGSVARQMYTIFFASATGIYQLVPGKTSDTLYIEDDPGETIDVKIPNPFLKTGFFGN